MRVLVACEYSGVVRDAFSATGHEAISADLLPTDSPGPHFQGDVLELLKEPFDLVIAHPPCTYLSNSGVTHLHTNPERWTLMREGAEFFRQMFNFNSPRIAVENPVQHKYAIGIHGKGKATQYIQPWQFGHTEQKRTGLWLRNLPALVPTDVVYDLAMQLPKRERERLHYLGPSKDRWKLRSTTYKGIAEAMAEQWGSLVEV